MPVLTRRQQTLVTRKLNSIQPSIEVNDSATEAVWAIDEDFERPQKEMDFPLVALSKAPSRKDSLNNLRINTIASPNLHERYMSDEEEASPSPDSDTQSNTGSSTYSETESSASSEEDLRHKIPTAVSSSNLPEPFVYEEYKAEIAVAVPIVAIGRPKLVDITNIAPMQKWKRVEKATLSRAAVRNAASRIPQSSTKENAPSAAEQSPRIINPETPKRKDSLRSLAPSSWLPDDVTIVAEEEEDEHEHYFPDLELRNPPSYHDYDPYSLDPPRLSPRNSYSSASKQLGSVSRARNNSSSPNAMNNVRRGITRTLSIAKRQALHVRGDQQITKKPKMVPRAANEREQLLALPSFSSMDKAAV